METRAKRKDKCAIAGEEDANNLIRETLFCRWDWQFWEFFRDECHAEIKTGVSRLNSTIRWKRPELVRACA
jgi:hypothetical protein